MTYPEALEKTLEFLGWRKRSYQLTFPKNQRAQDIVLKDLFLFCHMNEDCPHTDPFLIGKWLGRQEVANRMRRHLYLSPEELFAIYGGVRTPVNKENRVA